ncbi:hypothetical protein B0H14DRAFT_2584548 [Mycena olivaceomarginata]|nr:hypothetical protein B0H14DRAFT_2584548 [Mycena olivaceomarginata]
MAGDVRVRLGSAIPISLEHQIIFRTASEQHGQIYGKIRLDTRKIRLLMVRARVKKIATKQVRRRRWRPTSPHKVPFSLCAATVCGHSALRRLRSRHQPLGSTKGPGARAPWTRWRIQDLRGRRDHAIPRDSALQRPLGLYSWGVLRVAEQERGDSGEFSKSAWWSSVAFLAVPNLVDVAQFFIILAIAFALGCVLVGFNTGIDEKLSELEHIPALEDESRVKAITAVHIMEQHYTALLLTKVFTVNAMAAGGLIVIISAINGGTGAFSK